MILTRMPLDGSTDPEEKDITKPLLILKLQPLERSFTI